MDEQKLEQNELQSDWWKEIATSAVAVAVLFALFGRDSMLKLYGFNRSAETAQTAEVANANRGDRRHAKVLVQTVQVQSAKANGKKWDSPPYELPDLKVRIRNRTTGQFFQTPVKQECLSATFNSPAMYVGEGDELELSVWDNDIQFDDLVGTYSMKVTAEMLKVQDLDLSFGQVLSLKIQLQPHVRVSNSRGVFTMACARR